MRLTLPMPLPPRPLFWLTIGLLVVAVGLGRSAPGTHPARREAVPRFHGVNAGFFAAKHSRQCFLDRENGRLVRVEFDDEESLDHAACSPWRDERGQHQVVSRWIRRMGRGSDNLPDAFGLARYTFPEGRMIDRVPLDLIFAGPPCWVPGQSPQVVFIACDGQIYRYGFEEAGGDRPRDADAPATPRQLTWRIPPPGLGLVYFKDMTWPTDPRLGGKLLVSLSYQELRHGKRTFSGPQLWWIALSGDGMGIDRCGRLTIPDLDDPALGDEAEERLPSVANAPGGGLALAYLNRERDRSPWELRVAPVEFDPATGTPRARHVLSRGLTGHRAATAPAFSLDGRWVYGFLERDDTAIDGIIAQRFSVVDALSTLVSSRSDRRTRPVGVGAPSHLPGSDLAAFVGSRLVERPAPRHARR